MSQPTHEQWRPVLGYEGSYEVSDQGRVRSLSRTVKRGTGTLTVPAKVLKPSNSMGYPVLNLWRNGQPRLSRVHRLVLEAFVGPCPDGMEGCHNNGDPSNARLSNLRWGTSGENKLDTVRHGRHVQARKTHCPKGHGYTSENTRHYTFPSGQQARFCRACERERNQRMARERRSSKN